MSLIAKDLRSKTEEELKEMLAKLGEEVKTSLSAVLDGSSKDTGKTKRIRRDIARIKTVLNEKKILSDIAENESEDVNA